MHAYLPPPAPLLAVLLCTLYVSLFHFLWGRRRLELAVLWPMALLGFALGHFLGELLGTGWPRLGALRVLEGSVGAWLFLGLGKRVRLG